MAFFIGLKHRRRRKIMVLKHLVPKLIEHRKQLHKIPEIGFELTETYTYVKDTLEALGYETETIARTGLVAKKAGINKEAIAFRADMDGLKIFEKNTIDFRSKNIGNMHACGHDGHMAILLGFAEYVSQIDTLNDSIVFVFQPAEEGPGGAKAMIETGFLEKYHVKKIFGIHLNPELEEGLIGLTDGVMTAQDGDLDVKIEGINAHGAQPHKGQDAILTSAHLIQQYQTITSRLIDPKIGSVLTIGSIEGGGARNVISNQVLMQGTIRTFDSETYEQIKTHIKRLHDTTELMYGVKITTHFEDLYPAVTNDHTLFEQVKSLLLEDEYKLLKPMMFAEDFSYYQQEVPGLFIMLGTKNDALGFNQPLHSSTFNFNETVLAKGVDLYERIARALHIF